MANVCCTCANVISPQPILDVKTEKPLDNRRLDCCGRLVCAECISNNPRFAFYCPFCQTPIVREQASQAPPAYSDSPVPHTPPPPPHPHNATLAQSDEPPPYDDSLHVSDEKHPDVLHHLSPDETVTSLALAYRVPINVLRHYNSIWSDHLITARKIILIPGQYYQGPSLAPEPVDNEQETERKSKIRRIMTRCKIHEYDVAVLYLEQEKWDFKLAAQRYEADEQWEKDHPIKGKQKASQVRSFGRRLASRT